MNKSSLKFGTFSGVSNVGITPEIKTRLSLPNGKGLCTLKSSATSDIVDEDGVSLGRRLKMIFTGIEGGGCTDTITTKSPSMFKIGLERVKYLLNAVGIEFPTACEQPTLHPNVQNVDSDIYGQAHAALEAYEANGGVVEQVAAPDANGNIIMLSKTAFNEVFEGTGFSYIYADLNTVNGYRIEHRDLLSKIDKEDKDAIQAENERYNALLDAQPVLPCYINEKAFDSLVEAVGSIESDASVFIKARDWNSKVKTYQPAK